MTSVALNGRSYTDLPALQPVFRENKVLQFRVEAFNAFNHTQFFGPAPVNGNISSALFDDVVKAAPHHLTQMALKFTF
jgi:hypothetical protein